MSLFETKWQSVLRQPGIRLISPSFLFDFRYNASLSEAGGVFTPPVHRARPTDPFAIHVRSDRGGISLAPFQVENVYPAHPSRSRLR